MADQLDEPENPASLLSAAEEADDKRPYYDSMLERSKRDDTNRLGIIGDPDPTIQERFLEIVKKRNPV